MFGFGERGVASIAAILLAALVLSVAGTGRAVSKDNETKVGPIQEFDVLWMYSYCAKKADDRGGIVGDDAYLDCCDTQAGRCGRACDVKYKTHRARGDCAGRCAEATNKCLLVEEGEDPRDTSGVNPGLQLQLKQKAPVMAPVQ